MAAVFLEILNMSISASWLILAVVLLRFLLKKAPRWITVFLWGIVALRLVAPFSFESALSLVPSARTIPEEILSGNTFNVNTGFAPIDSQVNDYLDSRYYEGVTVPDNNGVNIMMVLSAIWGIGAALLLVYAAVSYLRVRWSVEESVPYLGNIFLCDHVKSPFILGLFRPKIYLPSGMDAAAIGPVTAHEKAHLARRDHWWKPLGFLILAVHWFNPLCWAAYVLFCRDIELACDEKVIRSLDLEGKKQYSTALLECSMGRRLVTICPLAFGEVGVKERVKKVLNYKKPAFWLIAGAVIACGAVTVCFATNPKQNSQASPAEQIAGDEYAVDPVLAEAFLGRSQEEAINLLGLTEDNRDSSALGGSPGEAYNAAYSLCGMELNTTLYFGMDLFGSFAAETTLDDSDEAREAAATCVQLFRDQFLDYGYTKGTVSEGKIQDGTSFSYEEGVEKDLLQEFWAAEDGVYLTFRFYLNEEKNAHEYVELRIAKSDTTPGKINLHFEGARALAYFV